jgi:hypothetical protein
MREVRRKVKQIELTQGKIAIVDDEDFESLSKFRWFACKGKNTFYAKRYAGRVNGKQRMIWMHREILGLKPGDPDVDHRDGNGLNNQKKNLRKVTNSENAMNKRNQRGSLSEFKGVCWDKSRNKWKAQIHIDGKLNFLGYFDKEEDAARAYDEAAAKNFGDFAKLNFSVGKG